MIPVCLMARRTLVGLFGEGWCTSEFAGLHGQVREGPVKGFGKRTLVWNVIALLWAAEGALGRNGGVVDA